MDRFIDRTSAGEALAKQLLLDQPAKNSLIAGLVRGGIPVASAVANELSLPLDIILVRKLGFPQHQELAMGAITADGNYVLNDFVTNSMQVAPEIINNVIKHGRATSVLILAIRGQNRLANARQCLPQPSSSPHQLRHA
ncbi:MAG: hypothetical protein GY782_05935 [Gammaproteobacteria bacterium]|nr:hypothetical protein [Gammaproteobacteria bacterium]